MTGAEGLLIIASKQELALNGKIWQLAAHMLPGQDVQKKVIRRHAKNEAKWK